MALVDVEVGIDRPGAPLILVRAAPGACAETLATRLEVRHCVLAEELVFADAGAGETDGDEERQREGGATGRRSGTLVVRAMRVRRVGVAIAMLLGMLVACRQLVGIGDQPTADGAPCGGFAAIFGPDAAAGCQSCMQGAHDGVCTEASQCAADSDCQAALQCTQVGPFQDRFKACISAHPSGHAAVKLLYALQDSQCAGACALGSQWSCLGHVSSPVTAGVNASATFSFRDYVTEQPTAGMLVQVCNFLGCPGPSGATDDAGVVALTISGMVSGTTPTGYLSMTGDALGLEPMLFYWGFPTSEPAWQLGFFSITKTELATIGKGLSDGFGITLDPTRAIVASSPAPVIRPSSQYEPSLFSTRVMLARSMFRRPSRWTPSGSDPASVPVVEVPSCSMRTSVPGGTASMEDAVA